MGFAAGFQTGAQAVERGLRLREEEQQRRALREAAQAAPEVSQGYTAEQGAQLEAAAKSGLYDIGVKTDETGNFQGYTVTPKASPEMQGLMAPGQVSDIYGQRYAGTLAPERVQGLRMGRMADIISETDPIRAQQLRAAQAEQEFQAQYRPMLLEQTQLGLAGKRREEGKATDFDTGYAELSSQKFDTPEAKTEALLSLVERTQGPQAAQQLRASYGTTELNNIRIQAEKFDNEYKQARQRGVDSALEWFDKQNASFTLERDPKNPFRVIQVNADGSRQLFADARNERELGMAIDARAKPGGWLELAKYDLDARNTESIVAYREAAAREAAARSGAAANALSGVQLGYTRGPDGQLVQVMSGVRFNKRTGDMETVQIPLDQNIIPASALDPAKIAKQAEELVGTPIDPTNEKGRKHTAQSARQAVTDQIVNQYLGTGGPAGGPDLSPAGLAERIKNQAAPAAPQERPAPVTRQPAAVGIDTGRPSTNVNPVTGLPREAPAQAPNLVAAASRGLSAAESNYKAYLQGKLDRKEKLTVDEQMRARRFGLQ